MAVAYQPRVFKVEISAFNLPTLQGSLRGGIGAVFWRALFRFFKNAR